MPLPEPVSVVVVHVRMNTRKAGRARWEEDIRLAVLKPSSTTTNGTLSFQQYAAIVASGRCFYCGNPLPTAAAGLDRKENEDYTWDTVFPCCGKQPRSTGPRGCNETKSHEIAPILLFVRRWYEKSGKLPTEQDFADSVRKFEAERDKAFELFSRLQAGEVKKLRRAKSVSEWLATFRPAAPGLAGS